MRCSLKKRYRNPTTVLISKVMAKNINLTKAEEAVETTAEAIVEIKA